MLGAAGVECCTPLCPPFCGCVARGGGKEPRSGRLPRRLSCLAKSVRVWRWLARGLGSPASLLPRPLGESGLEDFLWRNSLKNLSRLYCQLSTERYPEAFSPRLLVDVCFFCPMLCPGLEAHAQVARSRPESSEGSIGRERYVQKGGLPPLPYYSWSLVLGRENEKWCF